MGSLLLVLVALVAASSVRTVVWEGDSLVHHIRVIDWGGRRAILFNDSMQSVMRLDDPLAGHFDYIEGFHLAAQMLGRPGTVCMLGLGGGSAARTFLARYPETMVVVAEIDPVVQRLAETFFYLPTDEPRLEVRLVDGRQLFKRQNAPTCDIVLVDAYSASRHGAWIPWHLTTREFFAEVVARMPEDGILAYNVIGSLAEAGSWQVQAITKTLRTSFADVWALPVTTSRNVVLLAFRQPPPGPEGWGPRLQARGAPLRLVWLASLLTSRIPEGVSVFVLTDEYAPIDMPGLMVD
ncbi:fused MFS/spermidine synthase [bacterium]|nr:fused MFS/spermidine synthase [bacterium]